MSHDPPRIADEDEGCPVARMRERPVLFHRIGLARRQGWAQAAALAARHTFEQAR
jgi:hypothetical protein